MDEVLLLDKPAGMTSFGVVARIRRVLSDRAGKKVKVGHTGTLDPFATGLMVIVTGKMCREAEKFSKLDKWYEATVELGKNSTTGDPEGEVTVTSQAVPSLDKINEALGKFTGSITQTPPIFSAIKINGERAYKLAREGKAVDMPTRLVDIFSLDLISYEYPYLKIRAHVSSGTYIRSLAQDIGAYLGTGAYCRELRRTQISDMKLDQAKTLADFGVLS